MMMNQMRFKWREFFRSGSRWRLWAAVLLVVGGISAYSFYQNHSGPGNFTPLMASASSSSASVEELAASSGSSYAISNTSFHAASVLEKQSAVERMVIQSSVLNMETSHVSKVGVAIEDLAQKMQGYVQQSNQSSGTNDSWMNLTVRIPSGNDALFLERVQKLGKVLSLNQNGQDVTQQHQDLINQLNEKRTEATAFTQLFSKATSMKDMLSIEQALTQVNAQIAALEKQTATLNHQVAFASVQINLSTPGSNYSPVNHPIMNALKAVGQVLLQSIVALISFVAWVLPWGIAVWLVYVVTRLVMHWRQKKSQK